MPPEYIEMKFCQTFNISPLEYGMLPSKKVDNYLHMLRVERQFDVREA